MQPDLRPKQREQQESQHGGQGEKKITVLNAIMSGKEFSHETPGNGLLTVKMGGRYLHIIAVPEGELTYHAGQMIRVSPKFDHWWGLIVVDSERYPDPKNNALFFRVESVFTEKGEERKVVLERNSQELVLSAKKEAELCLLSLLRPLPPE